MTDLNKLDSTSNMSGTETKARFPGVKPAALQLSEESLDTGENGVNVVQGLNQVPRGKQNEVFSATNKSTSASKMFNFAGLSSQVALGNTMNRAQSKVVLGTANMPRPNHNMIRSTDSLGVFRQVNGTSPDTQEAKRYQMSQASRMKELKMVRMNLKFVTLNMFSPTLRRIDLSHNKITKFPDDVTEIANLEHLRIDHNQFQSLPDSIWRLQKLTHLNAAHNQLESLPENFELLQSLEGLVLNDNRITQLPEQFGQLSSLRQLLIHNNRLATIPKDFSRLHSLQELSLEWFSYANPPVSRLVTNAAIIRSFRDDFCRSLGTETREKSIAAASPSSVDPGQCVDTVVTFADFVVYYHKLDRKNLSSINDIRYNGSKKRSIVHALCSSQHKHLLQSLLKPCDVPLQIQNNRTCCRVSKVIDVNQTDEKGWTPAILLVMNLNSLQRDSKKEAPTAQPASKKSENNNEKAVVPAGNESQTWNEDQHQQNERHFGILELLLENNAPQGSPQKVDLNIESHMHGHILHLTILRHQFDLAQTLIEKHGANANALNGNGSNIAHILFANFTQNTDAARRLASKFPEFKVDVNLVDNNGLAPIHVAVKKFQLEALQHAHQLNLQHENSLVFNFNNSGKTKTPLHYVIRKCNHEAFLFFIKQQLVDCLALDDKMRVPRHYALINSAFYRVLQRLERFQIWGSILHNSKSEQHQHFLDKQGIEERVVKNTYWNGLFFQGPTQKQRVEELEFSPFSQRLQEQQPVTVDPNLQKHSRNGPVRQQDVYDQSGASESTVRQEALFEQPTRVVSPQRRDLNFFQASASQAYLHGNSQLQNMPQHQSKRGGLPPKYMSTKNASANKFQFGQIRSDKGHDIDDESVSPVRDRGLPIQPKSDLGAQIQTKFDKIMTEAGIRRIEPLYQKNNLLPDTTFLHSVLSLRQLQQQHIGKTRHASLSHNAASLSILAYRPQGLQNLNSTQSVSRFQVGAPGARVFSENNRTPHNEERVIKSLTQVKMKTPKKPDQSTEIPSVETTRLLEFEPSKAVDLMRKSKTIKQSDQRTIGLYRNKLRQQKPQLMPGVKQVKSKEIKELTMIPKLSKAAVKLKKKPTGREPAVNFRDKFNTNQVPQTKKKLKEEVKKQIDSQNTNDNGNVFISNLNINVNLNINISMPSSPKNTTKNGEKKNQKRLEQVKQKNGIQNNVSEELSSEKSWGVDSVKATQEAAPNHLSPSPVATESVQSKTKPKPSFSLPKQERNSFIDHYTPSQSRCSQRSNNNLGDENIEASFMCTPSKPFTENKQQDQHEVQKNKILDLAHKAIATQGIILNQAKKRADLLDTAPHQVVNLLAEEEVTDEHISHKCLPSFRFIKHQQTYSRDQSQDAMLAMQTQTESVPLITENDPQYLTNVTSGLPFASSSKAIIQGSNAYFSDHANSIISPKSAKKHPQKLPHLIFKNMHGNTFERVFQQLTDSSKPMRTRLSLLFFTVAPFLSLQPMTQDFPSPKGPFHSKNSFSKVKLESKAHLDAIKCLQMAVQFLLNKVQSTQPQTIYLCGEIIHLLAKSNASMHKQDAVDHVNQNINDYSIIYNSTLPLVLRFENDNCVKYSELMRRGEINKFPKISPKLDSFLQANQRKNTSSFHVEKFKDQQRLGMNKIRSQNIASSFETQKMI